MSIHIDRLFAAVYHHKISMRKGVAMKASDRKELMTNTLAHRLGDAFQGMKEGPSRGTILLLVAVGLIVILVLAWRYFSHSSEESDSARWLKWDSLVSPEQLKEFADDKEMRPHIQGRLARIEEARRLLHDGLRDIGSEGSLRKEAIENIRKAARLYTELVDECTETPLLHQQVTMGAAKAHESLGEFEQAKKFYQQLAQSPAYKNTVLAQEAEEQLKRLETAERNGDLEALRKQYHTPSP